MGKLNYSNRRSDGVKLAAVVAKDLRKRIKPCSHKNENLSPIELSLEAKTLTDPGLMIVGPALAECLRPPPGYVVTRLQSLHLQGNALTAKCLKSLAAAMLAAAEDLEILDLSDNCIGVTDAEDALSWEIFLESLKDCTALRVLDLGKNHLDNCRPMEIFARVYLKQFKSAVIAWVNEVCGSGTRHEQSFSRGSIGGSATNIAVSSDDAGPGSPATEVFKSKLAALSVRDENISRGKSRAPPENCGGVNSRLVSNVSGLPSVQFIDLADCFMDDSGALFMSWILPRHRWTQQHVFRRIWGRMVEDSSMIVMKPNDEISKTGHKLLYLAEVEKYQPMGIAGIQELPTPTAEVFAENEIIGQGRKVSAGISTSSRRVSNMSECDDQITPPQAQPEGSMETLDWLRTRIQRSIIDKGGAKQVELWHAAIKLLCLVRTTMTDIRHAPLEAAEVPTTGQLVAEPEVLCEESQEERKKPLLMQLPPPPSPLPKTYAGWLLARQAPEPIEEGPVTPTMQVFKAPSARRKSSTPTTPSKSGQSSLDHNAGIFRLPTPEIMRKIGRFPEPVWFKILCKHADPGATLNDHQRDTVLEYAKERGTLTQEIEVLGKAVSLQVQRVLEQMGCLMYDDELEVADILNIKA